MITRYRDNTCCVSRTFNCIIHSYDIFYKVSQVYKKSSQHGCLFLLHTLFCTLNFFWILRNFCYRNIYSETVKNAGKANRSIDAKKWSTAPAQVIFCFSNALRDLSMRTKNSRIFCVQKILTRVHTSVPAGGVTFVRRRWPRRSRQVQDLMLLEERTMCRSTEELTRSSVRLVVRRLSD